MRSGFARFTWAAKGIVHQIRVGQIHRYSNVSALKFIAAVLELNLSPECVCVIWLCSSYLGLAHFSPSLSSICTSLRESSAWNSHTSKHTSHAFACFLWSLLIADEQRHKGIVPTVFICEFGATWISEQRLCSSDIVGKTWPHVRVAYLVNGLTNCNEIWANVTVGSKVDVCQILTHFAQNWLR